MEAPREHHLRANGISHHVLEWGPASAAETVVLCHGFLDLAYSFAQLGPRLARDRRVLAIDFRGHGESGRVPEGGYYYFPDYVMDLHTLLPQLVSNPFHLVGHSMGSTVSTYYAATHQQQLRTLSLLEGLGLRGEDPSLAPGRLSTWLAQTPAVHRREVRKMRDLDEAFDRLRRHHTHVDGEFLRAMAVYATCPHPSGSGLRWRYDPLHSTHSPLAFDPQRFEFFLAQIETPTLVLSAEHGMDMAHYGPRMALLKRARHHHIAGAGHMLHWTHCEQVAAQLEQHFV
jgi:pimeloyl-ACP methyl ester carboxylesterase